MKTIARRLRAAVAALLVASPAFAQDPKAGAALGQALRASALLIDVGGSTNRPFGLLCAGQSNAVGRDAVGASHTNPANTYISASFMGATTFVAAQFGTAPINLSAGGSSTTTNPALADNNMCVAAAAQLRASGVIPASRPIVIVANAQGGQPISQWVGSGTSSPYWTNLTSSLNAASSQWPGFKIDHVIWAQGEGDNNASGSTNATAALYLSGFQTLLSQWRSLPQWQSTTTISVQELGDWADATQRDRNDVIRTFRNGLLDPYITTVTSSNMGESTESPHYHFSGAALDTLGKYHFQAWLEGRINGGYADRGLTDAATGGADVEPRVFSLSASSYALAYDDLRGGGASVVATGVSSLTLPSASGLNRAVVDVFVSGGSVALSSASAINSDFGATLGPGAWRVVNANGFNQWYVSPLYGPQQAIFYYNNTTATLSSGAVHKGVFSTSGSTLTLPSSGLNPGSFSIFTNGGASPTTLTVGGSVSFNFPGGATSQTLTLSPGQTLFLTFANAPGGGSPYYYYVSGGGYGVSGVSGISVTSGLGTSPTVAGAGTFFFQITVGATGTPATTTVLGLPAAANDNFCTATDQTAGKAAVQTASTASSVTLTWPTAPANSDVIKLSCVAR